MLRKDSEITYQGKISPVCIGRGKGDSPRKFFLFFLPKNAPGHAPHVYRYDSYKHQRVIKFRHEKVLMWSLGLAMVMALMFCQTRQPSQFAKFAVHKSSLEEKASSLETRYGSILAAGRRSCPGRVFNHSIQTKFSMRPAS